MLDIRSDNHSSSLLTPRLWEEKGLAGVHLHPEDKPEILRYIGYSGQKLTPDLLAEIDSCMEKVNRAATPRLMVRVVPCQKAGVLPDRLTFLTGSDIERHLMDAEAVVLMGATIGSGVDRAIHVEEMRNALDALIMDACGSALIEAVCDSFEAMFRSECEEGGMFLTSRFSPGYGNLPLAIQNHFCDVIESRRIGLTVTPEHIMSPRKSVTAVLGIQNHPQKKKRRTCSDCNLREHCRFRARHTTCGADPGCSDS